MSKKWYVVHAYSGFEKNVARALEERIELAGQKENFGEILVPTEDVVEMRAGQKRKSERKFFPGYVLVKMEMNKELYHMIKNIQKVTGFLGSTGTPVPVQEKEIEKIMGNIKEGKLTPKTQVTFDIGEQVKVCEGPFASFSGLIVHSLLGHPDFTQAMLLSIGAFGGGLLGARLSLDIKEIKLKILVTIVLMAAAIKLVIDSMEVPF